MTPADIVAEAIAKAEAETPERLPVFYGTQTVLRTMQSLGVTYRRGDVVDAALAHVAERCAKAEESLALAVKINHGVIEQAARAMVRAEDAERRATKLRAALDAVHYELTTDTGEEQRDPQAIFRAKRRVAVTVEQDEAGEEAPRG